MYRRAFIQAAVPCIAAILILLLAIPARPVRAAGITYYVDKTNPSASDSNPGTSPALPFKTIGKAAGLALAGDTVSVLAGTYAETVKPTNNGLSGSPITFSAAPGVTVTGEAGNTSSGGGFRLSSKIYIVIDGFTIYNTADYGIYVSSSHDITISNNHVSYAGSSPSYLRSGIYLSNTTNSTLTGNTSDHNSSDGIRIINNSSNNWVEKNISFGNATVIDNQALGINLMANSNYNTIIRNITYSNEDSGIQCFTGSSHNILVSNLSYGNGDHGIDNNGSPYNVIIGNTVHGNVTVGINVEEDLSHNGSGGAVLMNNLSVDNGYLRLTNGGTLVGHHPGNIRVDTTSTTSPAATTLDYDLIYSGPTYSGAQIIWGSTNYYSMASFQATGQETHGLQADPLFLASAPIQEQPPSAPYTVAIHTGDYHLNSGSPAIDSANSDAPNEKDHDIEGSPRVDDPEVEPNTGSGTRTYDDRGAFEHQPKSPQTISWDTTPPADAAYLGPTYTPTASATSGLPVTITVDAAASSICSITAGVLSFIGVGNCVLDANQAGDGIQWLPAPQVQQTFAVGKANQVITFPAPASPAAYNSTFMVSPTSTSGLVVTVAASGVCSIVGSTVTMTGGTGTCTLTASQPGNANYHPAVDVMRTVTAQKVDQSNLTVTGPDSVTYGITRLITYTGGSGTGGVSYGQSTSTGCTVNATTGEITVTNASGICSVTVAKAADDDYNASTSAEFGVTLNKAAGSVSINNLPGNAVFGGSFTPTFTQLGDGMTSIVSLTASTCTATAGVVNFSGVGTCTLQASIAENPNYLAAVGTPQSFTIGKAPQTITVTRSAPATAMNNSSFSVEATASSGLTVLYSASGACTNTSGTFTITSASGICSVHYSQPGNGNYAAAPEIIEGVLASPQVFSIYLPLVVKE
jgi:parallel beta-helix repeat protein